MLIFESTIPGSSPTTSDSVFIRANSAQWNARHLEGLDLFWSESRYWFSDAIPLSEENQQTYWCYLFPTIVPICNLLYYGTALKTCIMDVQLAFIIVS